MSKVLSFHTLQTAAKRAVGKTLCILNCYTWQLFSIFSPDDSSVTKCTTTESVLFIASRHCVYAVTSFLGLICPYGEHRQQSAACWWGEWGLWCNICVERRYTCLFRAKTDACVRNAFSDSSHNVTVRAVLIFASLGILQPGVSSCTAFWSLAFLYYAVGFR